MRHRTLILVAGTALLALGAGQARAGLIINATFDSTFNATADPNYVNDEAAINNLITNTYEKDFTNPITVSIDFSTMTSGLGQSDTSFGSASYRSYRSALIADKQAANGGDGNTAFLSNLTPGANPVPGNAGSEVEFSSAQGRALGFGTLGDITVAGQTGTFDSQISLNTNLTNNSGYSITSVAAHEINEALGLHSALEDPPSTATPPSPPAVGSLDFFRYSASGTRSFTTNSSAQAYFSDNGGSTAIVYFNQQAGADFHDFASNPGADGTRPDGSSIDGPHQVQDAFAYPGSSPSLGPSEFAALNDIGYNNVSPAPEPSPAAVLGLGILGLGALRLRARRRA